MNNEKQREKQKVVTTISRILPDGRLVELVCSRNERKTRLAVGSPEGFSVVDHIDAANGERWVPIPYENNLIQHGVLHLPEKPESYGSIASLVDEITAYLDRYVDLTPDFRLVAASYILLTWVYDAVNELPYLRLRGDFGTGKTRALIVIGSLCYKAFFASGASTVSPIFHILNRFGGTMVLDEADFRFSDEKAELVKIFNNGNVKGFPVLRTSMNQKHEYDPRAFNVYGPKLIAMRHSFEDEALESRFITETMGLRPTREGIPTNLPAAQADEAQALRNKLLAFRFAKRNDMAVSETKRAEGSDRGRQIMAPLLALAPDQATKAAMLRTMSGVNDELRAERADLPEAALVEVLIDVVLEGGRKAVPIKLLAARLIEKAGKDIERPITARYVGSLLRRRLHLSTYRRSGSYVWPLVNPERLEVLAARYGIEPAGFLSLGQVERRGLQDIGDVVSDDEGEEREGSEAAEPLRE